MYLGAYDRVDAMSTPYLFEASDIFAGGVPEYGKCFTMMRHPVERAISLYFNYQLEPIENKNTDIYKGLTIDECAEKVTANNWMVRFLIGKHSGNLSWQDLEVAKEGECFDLHC